MTNQEYQEAHAFYLRYAARWRRFAARRTYDRPKFTERVQCAKECLQKARSLRERNF